ncbi:MAG: hypothetical protein ACT4R6_03610, partial [Gemmatimonadaceae bacterium]
VLLFHISNRFFQLLPVLAAGGPHVRMSAFVFSDSLLSPGDVAAGKYASEWVTMASGSGPALTRDWVRVPPSGMRTWTDDYSNPLAALKRDWIQ